MVRIEIIKTIDRLNKNDLRVVSHILKLLRNDEVTNKKIVKNTRELIWTI